MMLARCLGARTPSSAAAAALQGRTSAPRDAVRRGVCWLCARLTPAMPRGVKRLLDGVEPAAGAAAGPATKRVKHQRPSVSAAAVGADSVTEADQQQAVVPDFDWLIVGLGNPGGTYADTRHNVGFLVLDEFARKEGIECRKLEKSAAVGRGQVLGQKVLLVKPMTFMNNSGESVRALSAMYKVPPSRILIISDDLDQPTAGVKLKPKGGHGGHNGLRSVIDCLGSAAFPRLKIGIGRPPPEGQMPIPEYVLQHFSAEERVEVDAAISQGVQIVRNILELGFERAMSGVKPSA